MRGSVQSWIKFLDDVSVTEMMTQRTDNPGSTGPWRACRWGRL